MKEYKVTFNFGKEQWFSFLREAERAEDIEVEILNWPKKWYQTERGVVNLDNVNYFKVTEYGKSIKTLK